VAVVGASTGAFGAVWSQAELRKILAATGARVLDVELALGARSRALGRAGRLAGRERSRAAGRDPRRAGRSNANRGWPSRQLTGSRTLCQAYLLIEPVQAITRYRLLGRFRLTTSASSRSTQLGSASLPRQPGGAHVRHGLRHERPPAHRRGKMPPAESRKAASASGQYEHIKDSERKQGASLSRARGDRRAHGQQGARPQRRIQIQLAHVHQRHLLRAPRRASLRQSRTTRPHPRAALPGGPQPRRGRPLAHEQGPAAAKRSTTRSADPRPVSPDCRVRSEGCGGGASRLSLAHLPAASAGAAAAGIPSAGAAGRRRTPVSRVSRCASATGTTVMAITNSTTTFTWGSS